MCNELPIDARCQRLRERGWTPEPQGIFGPVFWRSPDGRLRPEEEALAEVKREEDK